MFGIGLIDKNGFLEFPSASGVINYQFQNNVSVSGVKLAEDIAKIGNEFAKESDLIDKVGVTTIDGSAAIEVYLKKPVEPVNLQYNEHAKKYIELNLATKGKAWKWSKEPTIGIFVFKLYTNTSEPETIPVTAYAFAGKNGKGYINTRHPNVGENGAICMGSFSGHERISELSVRSLASMLTNLAIYSSYFKPSIEDLETGSSIVADTTTIRDAVNGVDNHPSKILRKHSFIKEWL